MTARARRGGDDAAIEGDIMVLIAGGTGMLGSRVGRILLKRGDNVRVMTRFPDRERALELRALGAEVVTGDVRDAASVRRAVAGADSLVISVQAFAGPNATRDNCPKTCDREGVRTLLNEAKAAGVRHVVYISIVGASPEAPIEFVRIKHEMEAEVRDSGMTWTILRPAAFMEVWGRLIGGPVLSGDTAMVFGDGENPVNFVSVDDVAEFVVRAIDGAATSETLTVGGPENFTLNQVVALFATEAKAQPKVRKMPVGVMRVMSRLMSPFNPGLSRQMGGGAWMASTDQRVDMAELLQRYPVELTHLTDVARGLVAQTE